MQYGEFVTFAKSMFEAGLPFLVEGQPGIAKTALIAQATREISHDLVIMEPAYKSPIDFGGVPAQAVPSKNGKSAEWDYLPVGELRRLTKVKKPTVLFFDDFGQGSPATQNATCHLLHGRRCGESELSDHVRMCAATNRAKDKSGTYPILEHVKSRFATIVKLEVDHEYWINWAFSCDDVGLISVKKPMPKVLPAFIAWKGADMLMNFEPKPDLQNSRSPRTVHHVGQLLAAGSVTEDNAFETISRAVDRGFATEFLAFLKLHAHLPDPEEVLADPDILDKMTFERFVWNDSTNTVISAGQTTIARRPDVAYSLVTSIAGMVEPEDMDNYVDVLDKFQKPVETMGMILLKNNPKWKACFDTTAFIEWVSENDKYMPTQLKELVA